MLGKLLKHEFIAMSRVLVPLHLFLILVTIIGKVTLNLELVRYLPELLNFLLLLTYILVIIVVPITTSIFVVVRFYKNMYTDEGYLMWTLPAKPWEHLVAKGCVASLWLLLDIGLIFASLFMLLFTGQIGETLTDPVFIEELNKAFGSQLGMSASGFFYQLVAACVIGCVSSCFMCYLSISIGQLFTKHRVLGAFLAYFVLYLILQVAEAAIMLTFGITLFSRDVVSFGDVYSNILLASSAFSLIFGVICFFATLYFMKKKVNLQ